MWHSGLLEFYQKGVREGSGSGRGRSDRTAQAERHRCAGVRGESDASAENILQSVACHRQPCLSWPLAYH